MPVSERQTHQEAVQSQSLYRTGLEYLTEDMASVCQLVYAHVQMSASDYMTKYEAYAFEGSSAGTFRNRSKGYNHGRRRDKFACLMSLLVEKAGLSRRV